MIALAPALVFVLTLALAPTVSAQPAADGTPRPTVTADMRDAGGKFFGKAPDPQRTRHYYVAAEPELWDYAPAGRDEVCGLPLPPPLLKQSRVSKIRYVQYSDATFAAKVFPNPRLGILGPVLRGVVGDYLVVTFHNRTSQPLSMHPHGVRYDKDSEGAYYQPSPGAGAAVGPGATFTYVWFLDEASGPQPHEPSSKPWLYHSHVTGDEEVNLGLVGTIVVTDPKRARPDGTPVDVDREFATLFLIFDESGLGAAEREAAEYASLLGPDAPAPKTWSQVQELMEQGARASINGYVFGNHPDFAMNEGERVRWYVMGLGSERDFHTAHWHGLRVLEDGRRRTDVVELLPATMKVADMVADNPGSWLMHCHVADHMREGMFARMVVHPRDAVGVDRSPAHAFLGHRAAQESLEIVRAEAVVDGQPGAEARTEVRFDAVVSVFEAFTVPRQTIRVQLGNTSVTLTPDRAGRASGLGLTLRVKNANEYGVIYGGRMELEIVLTGEKWRDELQSGASSQPSSSAGEFAVPLLIEVGTARHQASARIRQSSHR